MTEFVIHSIPGSPYGRSALTTLIEKGAPWRLAAIPAGTLKNPEHRALHPFARIPVLDHDGFRLYETQAIIRYIDRVVPHPPLTPADPRAAAVMDCEIGIADWYLFPGAASVIGFQRIVKPRIFGGTPREDAIAEAVPKARLVFAELARLLGDKPFLAGEALSLADLHVAPQMAFVAETPEWAELTAPHPNLAAWTARITSRPSFRATTWDALETLARAA